MNHNPYSVGDDLNNSATELQAPKFEAAVRGMQIIAVALMMGVLMFLGVVLVLTQGDISGKPETLTMMAAGFGFLMIVLHFVIPAISFRNQLRQAVAEGLAQKSDDERTQRVVGIYQATLIVGLALLEGAAFFNLIAMMAEHCVASLGVVTLLVCLMLVKFPTRSKVSWWVEDKLRELQVM